MDSVLTSFLCCFVCFYTVTFTIPIGVKWIKVNSGQNGYYRVLYDEDNWGYIVEELKANHETFSSLVWLNIDVSIHKMPMILICLVRFK